MDRRLLILGVAVLIAALIIGAAPVAGSQTTLLKKILKEIQALHSAPPEPTGYEYYTGWMRGPMGVTCLAGARVINEGNTPANA